MISLNIMLLSPVCLIFFIEKLQNRYPTNYIILLHILYIDRVSPKGPYLAGAASYTYLCFWLTVNYYKISWVRADGHSGILVPQGIYIHINISDWDFIYLSIIAVKFCNI